MKNKNEFGSSDKATARERKAQLSPVHTQQYVWLSPQGLPGRKGLGSCCTAAFGDTNYFTVHSRIPHIWYVEVSREIAWQPLCLGEMNRHTSSPSYRQHQYDLGACWKCRLSGPTPNLLNKNLPCKTQGDSCAYPSATGSLIPPPTTVQYLPKSSFHQNHLGSLLKIYIFSPNNAWIFWLRLGSLGIFIFNKIPAWFCWRWLDHILRAVS